MFYLSLFILLSITNRLRCEFMNEFAVEVKGGEEVAKRVAKDLGFTYVREIEPVEDHYLFSHERVAHRHKREAEEHTSILSSHPEVLWVEQQKVKHREKREKMEERILEDEKIMEREAYQILAHKFNDPMWKNAKQDWYMFDHTVTPVNDSLSVKMDLKVLPVWQKGYTGKGVVVSILDDGLEWNHTDLLQNYAPHASYDLNDEDKDPFTRYDFTNENEHGTRCAGVIAMVANNNWCGVGIAPDAKVGGIRMLDGTVNEVVEARSIGFNVENIDIMSASWGPTDNGRMVDGPGKLVSAAFIKGTTKGRRGKGVIYVWASGNGGHRGDNCECDGYASSPYTISISSASTRMHSPYYVEHCPSTMATTFSSGGYNELQIVSSTLHDGCTDSFTGTSAAAPQAAGIIALVLEANPELTWRDVQHLIVWSASPYILYNNPGWQTNAAGFKVNHRFGFGLMNAIDMVELAETWKNVGARMKCEVNTMSSLPRVVSPSTKVSLDITVDDDCGINYLEHVELVLTVKYSDRGALSIDLISAQGTNVSLIRPRDNDNDDEGYKNWPFMSVQTWGENPQGKWQLHIYDNHKNVANKGQVESAMLRMYGTKEMPDIMKNVEGHRRSYNFQMKKMVSKKYSNADTSSDLIGTIGGLFNIGRY